jgi:hypothetical protein
MSGSPTAFCTTAYGLTQLTPPWYLHPNEILDGALTGPYRTAFAMSWTVANNPLLSDLYRRHGRDWNFLGVISLRTEWTTQTEKQLMANQTAKLARQLGAQGAVVTWDAGGNEFIEGIALRQHSSFARALQPHAPSPRARPARAIEWPRPDRAQAVRASE